MKNKILIYITAALIFLLAGNIINVGEVFAASANIKITADSNEITVGEDVFVYITLDSETEFGNFEANLIYDDEILEYKSGASVVTGGSGFLRIYDMGVSEGTTNRKYALEFSAVKVGTCKIELQKQAMVYDYESEMEMSISSNVLNVNVKAEETASNNSNLKTLKISPSELSPQFDKSIYEYTTNVGYETEKLIINALPEDSKATVSISGNDFLKEGENKIIVSVLAESGTVIEYIIRVTKEAAPQNENGLDDINIIPGTSMSGFELVQEGNDIYAVFNGQFKIAEPGADVEIPEGYKKDTINISGITINAYTQIDEPYSDFILIYAINKSGEANFYQYDRIEKTLQRFVSEDTNGNDQKDNIEDELLSSKEYRTKLTTAAIVIALLSGLCALFIVISIRLFIKLKDYKD